MTAAFANFWYDGYGDADLHCTGPIQTEFVEMWGYLASRLGGHPAVIGYDILNEPWPGTTPPGVFEQTQLMPMYQRVAAAIREYDQKTPIFFEPVAIYTNSIPTMGEAPDPNAVFAPHIYTEALATNGDVTFGGLSEETTLSKVQADAQRMGVPMWIGEWGLSTARPTSPGRTTSSIDTEPALRSGTTCNTPVGASPRTTNPRTCGRTQSCIPARRPGHTTRAPRHSP